MSTISPISPIITIITPTFKRNTRILKRCIDSINSQTYPHWRHLIIADDKTLVGHVSDEIIEKYSSEKRQFIPLGHRSNNSGNSPRIFGISKIESEFTFFFDDDNVVFPNYLETCMDYFKTHPQIEMSICKIIHLGPLPAHLCPPPKVLNGNPPVLQNIDTLQACIRSHIVKTYGWLETGVYLADGYTLENFAKNCKYGYIDDVLGVHL